MGKVCVSAVVAMLKAGLEVAASENVGPSLDLRHDNQGEDRVEMFPSALKIYTPGRIFLVEVRELRPKAPKT